jgi:hypothetical protein
MLLHVPSNDACKAWHVRLESLQEVQYVTLASFLCAIAG